MGKLRGEELHQSNFMRNREQGYRSDKHNAEKI